MAVLVTEESLIHLQRILGSPEDSLKITGIFYLPILEDWHVLDLIM